MANGSLWKIKETGIFQARFRFGGKSYCKSLKTKSKVEAKDLLGEIRNTIRKLEAGDLTIPNDADVALFILTKGKLEKKPELDESSIATVFENYHDSLPEGAKAKKTLTTERSHFKALLAYFKPTTPFRTITNKKLSEYALARSKAGLTAVTIKKEIATFSVVWHWAEVVLKLVNGCSPTKGVTYGKTDDKQPFLTWAEIETKVNRGGLTEEEIKILWNALFLDQNEIKEFLNFVETESAKKGLPAFLFPLLATCCMTGCRRSEVCRSETDDWKIKDNKLQIRERKRKHKGSFREITIHQRLRGIVEKYLAEAEASRWMFFTTPNVELTAEQATHYFDRLVEGTKWDKIKGFHCFRHSFASNLAAKGTHQAVINGWMGHQTQEMQARYRHLFPQEKLDAMNALDFG
jgi:integrase